MSIRKRTLAAAAGIAFAVTAVVTPAALAGGDNDHDGNGRRAQPATPDPTTCTDGLLTLVKVRTDEHRLGATVTVAERQDAQAQRNLAKAQADFADAKAVEAGTKAKLATAKIELDKVKAEPVATPGHAGRLVATQNAYDNAYKAYADAQADRAKAEADLVRARQDAEAKRSYLAELRVKQTNEHSLVVRLTLLVDHLCQKPTPVPAPIPTPEPTTEQPPPPVDTTPPVDNTPPAPVIVNQPQTQIVNNPAIGQVPTGSNTGGGAEAATVE